MSKGRGKGKKAKVKMATTKKPKSVKGIAPPAEVARKITGTEISYSPPDEVTGN